MGTPLSELEQTLVPIYNFHRYQVQAVAKLIGGVSYSYETKQYEQSNQPAEGVSAVNAKQQSSALKALLRTLKPEVLTIPQGIIELIPPKAYGYSRNRESFSSHTGLTFDPITAAEASAKFTLDLLLNHQRLARIEQQSAVNDDINNSQDIIKVLLDSTLYQKSQGGTALLIQQRVNQQVVQKLIALWQQQGVVPEVRAQVHSRLLTLNKWLDKNQDSKKYRAFNAQFTLLSQEITYSLAHGKKVIVPSEIKLPPGSPIGN